MNAGTVVGAPAPPAEPGDKGAEDRETNTQSVAGEEDPGSALEQFSDLMKEAAPPSHVPGTGRGPAPAEGEPPGGTEGESPPGEGKRRPAPPT